MATPLYPEPLRAVCGEVLHQQELTKPILRAAAQVRKTLAARQRERGQQKIGDLFAQRYLLVQHDVTPAERRTLQRITRGLP